MRNTENRLTAVLLFAGAVLANIAFIGLGSAFNYPEILQQPAEKILREFTAHQGVIVAWFLVLALGAGLMAPIAVLVSRLLQSRLSRWVLWTGVMAAGVQVIGLLRWPLIVPSLAARGDAETFELLHTILGTAVGETLGYLFTGLWTILVVRMVARFLAGPWFSWFGTVSAGLIVLGVFVPIGLPGVDVANFVGYVLWSVWLIVFAVLLWRRSALDEGAAETNSVRRATRLREQSVATPPAAP